MGRMRLAVIAAALAMPISMMDAEPLPRQASAFLSTHCTACHSGTDPPAGIQLDLPETDWSASEAAAFWEQVYNAVDGREMPPRGAAQPSDTEREEMAHWLEAQLVRASSLSTSVPRRLNRQEYENTIRDLFDMPSFRLPDAFPADDSKHGFDNVGEGLVLSPPLMAQLLAVATDVADEILPPDSDVAVAESKRYQLGTTGLAMEGGGHVDGGAFRLMSSRNMASAAAWPARFEARQSGVYRIRIAATTYQTDQMFYPRRTDPFHVAVYARPKTDQVYAPFGEIRKLAEFHVDPVTAQSKILSAEIELIRGETFGIRWVDGPAYSDPPKRDYSHAFLAERLKGDRLYYAPMLQFKGGPRGATQTQIYEGTRRLMESGTLDLADPRLDELPKVWGGGLSNAPHNWIKAFVHEEMYRFGPAVDITDTEVEGPIRLFEDDAMRARKTRTNAFLGQRAPGATDSEHAESVLRRFLPLAFRRPASEEQLRAYAQLVEGHLESSPEAGMEDGLHLAVRRALVSPNFLYREVRPGRLDDYDLASRLSYFLTSAPPDDRLSALARESALGKTDVLASETERLIASQHSASFVSSFTGQWLSTRALRGIMPDPRLLQFGDPHRQAMIDETEMFFAEIMRENLPLKTFIDPGFSYRSARLNRIYGGNLQGNQMRRVTFERGGRHGGVLGLASIMMATANGVDTHPVLRGVWLLDNVLGDPTPEPPPDVPAIAPDTSGTHTIRDQLAAHRADPSCARCHNRIDPLGMVLENFDPVGRWREHYPVYSKPPDGAEALKEEYYSTVGKGTAAGPAVDSVGVLADGTRLEDIADFKRYILEHIDMFSRCLTGKLLVYATGRPLNFEDRRTADRIVETVARKGNGFRDLIVAVVQSESFASR